MERHLALGELSVRLEVEQPCLLRDSTGKGEGSGGGEKGCPEGPRKGWSGEAGDRS